MATNTAGSTARVYHQAQTHFFSRTIAVATDLNGAVYSFWLPAGATILRAGATVAVAFNYATNNRFNIGTTSGGAELSSVTSLAAAGQIAAVTVFAQTIRAADTQVFFTLDLTGGSQTTGSATLFMEYLPSEASMA